GFGIRDSQEPTSTRTADAAHESRIPNPGSLPSSASSSGDRAAPRTTQALRPAGNRASAASADSRSGNSTKPPLPVPVSRGDPTCASAAKAASTAGSRRRNTGSNALPSEAPETKSDIVAGAAFRVNSGAANSSAVATWTPGSTSTYQAGASASGVRRSPTSSAQALRPWTNTGTSAPSARPSAASRSTPRSSPQRRSRARSTVAAAAEPAPKPP